MFIENKQKLTTKVLECSKTENGYNVKLEDTIFYYESGGQPSDTGFIGGQEIISMKEINLEVVYTVTNEISGEVELVLDQEKRYQHSLLHSTQHLVSAVFDKYEAFTSSLNMGENYFTIDLSKKLNQNEINSIEREINSHIINSIEYEIRLFDENLDSNLKKVPKGVSKDDLRLVILEELDKNPCGGTHIKNTREIKMIKIIKVKTSRDGIRIWVICGDYCVNYMQEVYDNYAEIVRMIGVGHEECVEVLKERLKQGSKNKKTLKKIAKQYNLELK